MKIRCDLKIQNLNHHQTSCNQEKLHKQCMIGLYRPRPDDDDYNTSSSNSAASEIILTIEAKAVNLKYKLKRIETHTKFINEGKATLKLVDENIYLLLSNCPALTLINFVSFLNVKMTSGGGRKSKLLAAGSSNDKENVANRKPPPPPPNSSKAFAARLLERAECKLGPSHLKNISPLCENDLNVIAQRKLVQQNMESPITARNGVSKPKIEKQASFSSLVQLTDEQKHILDVIKQGKNVFFTGSGGTGKSFLINLVKKCFPNDSCMVTASTGCAAALIGGITLHAFAGFTLGADRDNEHESPDERLKRIVERICNSKEKLNNWKRCRQLIIDEISMIDAEYFDTLEAVARSVKNSDLPFGGIQLIVCGDFLQLPPVSKRSSEKKKFCFQAKTWSESIDTIVQLTQIKRQKDRKFIEMLEEIRFGKCSKETIDLLEKSKSNEFADARILPTRLCTHKDDVEFINRKELEALETGPTQTYRALDEGDLSNASSLGKLLNLLSPARDELQLKVGAQVMLIKNMDVAGGLVNGSRGYVVAFEADSRAPIVRFMNGLEVPIRYEQWSFRVNAAGASVTRRQLPLQLAWAMSIHKSQGMTLDCVEISLSRVFEFGQAYVALSRAKSLASIKLVDFDANSIRANEVVVKFYRDIRVVRQCNRLEFDD